MINQKRVRLYDNGGKTADRYTAVYLDHVERGGMYGCRGMSSDPFHPQGVGMYGAAMPGRHLGRRISWEDLPAPCRRAVEADLSEG